MPYTKDSIPPDHTEFGGGPGLIDPVLRADRLLTPEQELIEIYATNPSAGAQAGGSTPEEIEANKALGELHSKPETAVIERP
jgi:hypothetical protein